MHRRLHSFSIITLLWLLLSVIGGPAVADEDADDDDRRYRINYTISLDSKTDSAEVVIEIPDARLLRELDFNLAPNRHSSLEANGELVVDDGRAVWTPPPRDARMSLRATIKHERDPGEYDAFITDDWAIFRGDDLVPPARVTSVAGAKADARLRFELPEDWPSVNAGWRTTGPRSFEVDNPERRFDRPTGWMIAGKLGTRRDRLGSTRIAVSAPKGTDLRRMDTLTFINVVWPEVEEAFEQMPPKLLLVGAGKPMWRGGLSAPNSLFLHEDRPLVSENGTSPLVHELVHMVTGIQGADGHDWIAEGLTEYYSVELLHRAGAMTDERRDKVFQDLAEWGRDVETLVQSGSTGAVTARAAVLFDKLDREIRKRSEHDLDAVARGLMTEERASLADLEEICRDIVGARCQTLDTPLLDPAAAD